MHATTASVCRIDRRLRALAIATVLGFAFACASPLRARAEIASGAVYVTTLPSGAEIWIDGVYVGRSPVYVAALTRGRHTITITKGGWNVRESAFEIATDTTTMQSVALEPAARSSDATGTIVVRGAPDGAKLAIDGRAVDAGAPLALAAGAHKIAVETAHGAKTTRSFTVVAETLSVLVLREPPLAARSRVVALADDYVPGAYTLENGKVVVRYEGHVVVARLGDPVVHYDGTSVSYDSSPETIGGKLYLPLEVLVRLTGGRADDDAMPSPAPPPRVRATVAPAASSPAIGPTLSPSSGPTK